MTEEYSRTKELWREFPEFHGLHVSTFGNVYLDGYSLKDNMGRNLSFPSRTIKPHVNYRGYYCIKFSYKRKIYRYRLHRLVAMTFIQNPESKLEVNHLDGDKSNNSVWNLEWATRQENVQHALDTGLMKKRKYFIKNCCICGKLFVGERN